MARINSYYCHHSAMKIAAKGDKMTGADRKRLNLLNDETKSLVGSTKMSVHPDFFYLNLNLH